MEIKEDEGNNRMKSLMSLLVVLVMVMLVRFVVFIPFDLNRNMGKFPTMDFPERITFLAELDSAYLGNIIDIGNMFAPYHLVLRRNMETGLNVQDRKIMIYEIIAIDKVLENGLQRSNYGEMKVLMSAVGMRSLLVTLTEGADKKKYYDEGIFYMEKMKITAPENPIADEAKVILDYSLNNTSNVIKKNN